MRIALLVMLVACGDSATTSPDGPPADELAGLTVGPRGQAGFQLEYGDPSRAIAERANTYVIGRVRSTAPVLATVTSDDPSILAITKLTQSDPLVFAVELNAPGAGDGDLVLRDASGTEIDRVTLHVRASDTLDLLRKWGTGDALVLAGEVERMHVTTMTAGVVTAGSGAVEFTLAGALSAGSRDAAPWLYSEGDEVFFRTAASGTGSITAQAPDATTVVNVTIVPATSLTAITATPTALELTANTEGNVTIGATAAGSPVFGPRCTWSGAPALKLDLLSLFGGLTHLGFQSGWIGDDPSFVYSISGPPGTYQATCMLPGGLTTTIAVHIR